MFRQGVLIALLIFGVSHTILAAGNITSEISQQFQQAESLAKQGQLNQAIDVYEALIKQYPRLPEAYNNLAALYLKQHKSRQAKSVLEQGLQAHKGYGALYKSLTAINVAMARDAYSKALQIDLKPSEVAIETLALNDEQPRKTDNAIVISQTEAEMIVNDTEEKAAVIVPEPEQSLAPKVSAEIKPAPDMSNPLIVSVTTAPITNNAIETVVQAWAAAWSAQAIDIYLSFYHDQFRAVNGMLRKSWEQSRRIRIKKPEWIKVTISDYKVMSSDSKQAIVTFKQHYESNGYADVTSKRMILLYTDSGWQISEETSL